MREWFTDFDDIPDSIEAMTPEQVDAMNTGMLHWFKIVATLFVVGWLGLVPAPVLLLVAVGSAHVLFSRPAIKMALKNKK